MSAVASPSSAPSAAIEPAALAPAPLTFDALVKEPAPLANPELAPSPHRAIESVQAVADRLTTDGQRSVNLQFSVSGVDLAVRVELRSDGVHTTFRTDSPELCTALAHEWQSVSAAQPGENTRRLADPVFASSNSENLSQTGSGAADQRDSAPRHPPSSADEFAGPRLSRAGKTAAPAASSATPGIARHDPLPLAGRLHAFA